MACDKGERWSGWRDLNSRPLDPQKGQAVCSCGLAGVAVREWWPWRTVSWAPGPGPCGALCESRCEAGGPRAAVGAGLPSTSVAKCSRGQLWTRKIGLIKEGVNLLHVVARPVGRELLAAGRRPRLSGSPDPEERVADDAAEDVHPPLVIALPQTAG